MLRSGDRYLLESSCVGTVKGVRPFEFVRLFLSLSLSLSLSPLDLNDS